MDALVPFVSGWMANFLKNKDAFTRRIESIQDKGDGNFTISYKDGRAAECLILPDTQELLQALDREKHYIICLLNSRKSLDFLIANWKSLIDFRSMTIYFVNPLSQLEKKWIISPYTHNRICDDASLKLGLNSMFETVEATDEESLKARLK
ncbi:hypothetical protein J4212_03255 [Candidatus Woesearchaeota archaeon]|nr:hypothetical protein [Candidatus Woesearchaeota archaeon]